MPQGGLKTIGHSTLPVEVFLRALKENGCAVLVDVRRYPGSRRHPQFGQERLFASLATAMVGRQSRRLQFEPLVPEQVAAVNPVKNQG